MYCTYSCENGLILPGAMARSGVAWPDLGKGRRRRPLIDDGGIAPAVIEHGIDAAMMTLQPFEEAIGAVCESDSPGFGRRARQQTNQFAGVVPPIAFFRPAIGPVRSEEHTSELQSLMRISYAVFCLKKKNNNVLP